MDHACRAGRLDLLIADVRMPPSYTHDGLTAALEVRRQRPDLGIMILSQHLAAAQAQRLFSQSPDAGTGYLLKDRVSDVPRFITSLRLVAAGGVVIDPEVAHAMTRTQTTGLNRLSPRELDVLELMARGESNAQIADDLVVTPAAVAKHIARIFTKLDLPADQENRRVRAILTYLTANQQ